MGTFGTNRMYTVGRVVKVEDLMRFERFAPRGFDSLRISNAKFISLHAHVHVSMYVYVYLLVCVYAAGADL